MPKLYGGRTPLGQTINKISSKTSTTEMRRARPPRFGGIIKEIQKVNGEDQYNVVLMFTNRLTGEIEITQPIPLIDPPSTIAMLYGSPEDLQTGDYECVIEYFGHNSNSGVARIMRARKQDINKVAEYNQIDIQGAAFAPPGSGF